MKNQLTELHVNEQSKKALQTVIEMKIERDDYLEAFCEQLEIMEVNEEIYDYGELFKQALLQANIV